MSPSSDDPLPGFRQQTIDHRIVAQFEDRFETRFEPPVFPRGRI